VSQPKYRLPASYTSFQSFKTRRPQAKFFGKRHAVFKVYFDGEKLTRLFGLVLNEPSPCFLNHDSSEGAETIFRSLARMD
jgi:hypothetical protein